MATEQVSNSTQETAPNSGVTSETGEETNSAADQVSAESTEDSETSETQNLEDGADTDADAQDEDSEDSEESKEDDKKPKQNGKKRRIDRLTKRLSEKERELEYWKQEALKGNPKAKGELEELAADKEVPSQDRPLAPRMGDFETHEDYEAARDAYQEKLAEWKLQQWESKQETKKKTEQLKTEFQKQKETYDSRLAEFKKTQADFDEIVSDFVEEHGDVNFSPALHERVVKSDMGPALVYELLKNPETFERINSLPPLDAAYEIGKIEARLSKSSETPKIEKKLTKAPAPISPVGGKGTGSVKKSIYDPSISFADYERARREEMKRRNA